MLLKNIPIIRIYEVEKAKEFYMDWLGFEVTFDHQFEPHMPHYIGIKKDDIELHLSGHDGDTVLGIRIFITCNKIKDFYEELLSRPYQYYQPKLEETFYGTLQIQLHDPFGNRLSFNEYVNV
jgi:uncharacterized glyoxalase superfamily protein PhnB